MAPRKASTPKVKKAVSAPLKVAGNCIQCYYLQTGWFHPRCGNPESPLFKQNVRDSDSCNKFTPKGYVATTATEEPEISEEDAEAGMFGPGDPSAPDHPIFAEPKS